MGKIENIEERNKRVENDKAWETSKMRRVFIAIITYTVAAFFMIRIGVPDPWLNAMVPTGGFLLSTLSLPYIKQWWIRHYGQ